MLVLLLRNEMKKPNFINFLKKKILKVYIADLIFFSLLLWFLVYARNRIFSYILTVQQFAPKLADISSVLSTGNPSSINQLDALIKVVEPIVREANIFVYLVVPVTIFMVWVLFQGLSWNFLKEGSFRKALDIRFYPKFALISIPIFAVIFYLFYNFFISENISTARSVVIFVLLFVVLYFTTISYLVVNKGRFFSNLFTLSIKRAKVFFPKFILFLVLLLLALVLFFNAFIAAFALVFPSFLSLFLLLLSILLFSSSKCFLVFLSE